MYSAAHVPEQRPLLATTELSSLNYGYYYRRRDRHNSFNLWLSEGCCITLSTRDISSQHVTFNHNTWHFITTRDISSQHVTFHHNTWHFITTRDSSSQHVTFHHNTWQFILNILYSLAYFVVWICVVWIYAQNMRVHVDVARAKNNIRMNLVTITGWTVESCCADLISH